jgi:hypothetical protein
MAEEYPKANRRKCYFNCLGCLKGHGSCYEKNNCPDYVSVAQADRTIKEKRTEYEEQVMDFADLIGVDLKDADAILQELEIAGIGTKYE